MRNDEFRVLRISRVEKESEDTRTFTLDYPLNSRPGQFVMLWLPGVGEKPVGISGEKGGKFSVSVCAVGPVSEAINRLKKGDRLGFRGPFGTSYTLMEDVETIATVGGGYGSAPLAYLAEHAIAQGKKVVFIEGARSRGRILFKKRMEKAGAEVLLATDDGSEGFRGYSTEVLENALKEHKIGAIYTCGPEIMMKKVALIAKEAHIPSQLSMERYMKCGMGICGQCAVDDSGLCMCRAGPVIAGETALGIKEFGAYRRGPTGRKEEW